MNHKFQYKDRVIINDSFFKEQDRLGIIINYEYSGFMSPDADRNLYKYQILFDDGRKLWYMENEVDNANCQS